MTDRASTFRLRVLPKCTPTFPNGIWGGRIAKNAGKTAVLPPPSPTVRVSQAFQIISAIFLQLTLQCRMSQNSRLDKALLSSDKFFRS